MQLDYVHVHHGCIIQIIDGRIVVEDVVDHGPTCRNLFSLTAIFLIIVMDFDEGYLLLESFPGGGIQTAVSDLR